MKAHLAICVTALVLAPLVRADVVEEETWYNADGTVVKKVKRVLSGADAKSTPDWEPAWVIRERNRGKGFRVSNGSSGYWPAYSGTRTVIWGSGAYRTSHPYYLRSCRTRGTRITGYYNARGGGSGWGVRVCAPGFSAVYRD